MTEHSDDSAPEPRCTFVGQKSNGYEDLCGLAEGHVGPHMAAVYTLLVDLDPRCKGTLGSRPLWMGVDQYDPCRCRLDRGHDGPHWCEHLDVPDPRTADIGRDERPEGCTCGPPDDAWDCAVHDADPSLSGSSEAST